MPVVSNFRTPALFGPRRSFTRQPFSNLRKARRLVGREQRSRAPGQGPWGFQSGEQINQTVRDFPIGWAQAHGGRSMPEVERDTYLNSLRAARGAGPIAPMDRRGFVEKWSEGVSQRANERYKAGGYR